MNKALYYIAGVLSLGYAIISGIGSVIYEIEYGDTNLAGHLMLWSVPVISGVSGFLFLRKYSQELSTNIRFIKQPIVSVVGIISMIIGLTWFSTRLKWVIDVGRMEHSPDISILENVAGPVVLATLGVYFGFMYKDKQVVDT